MPTIQNNLKKTVYISIGSNIGDLEANLSNACNYLKQTEGIILDAVSPVYITEAQDMHNQPWFHNQVIRTIVTDITPLNLLDLLINIEHKMGRVRNKNPELRYGPRVIDLDILLYEQEVCNNRNLCLPHPRMLNRAFVLLPLYDIEPALCFPGGLTLKAALQNISYTVKDRHIYQ